MIDLALLMPAKLREIGSGQLFLPVGDQQERFIGGNVNGTSVLMVLDGERRFQIGKTADWRRPTGLRIGEITFQVEPTSAANAFNGGRVLGSLILGASGLFIMGRDEYESYEVRVDRDIMAAEVDQDAVGFARWQIVATDPAKTILYERG